MRRASPPWLHRAWVLPAASYHDGNESPNYPERERYYPGSIRRKKLHLSGLYPDSKSEALSAEPLRTSLSGSSGRVICEGVPAESVKSIKNYPDSIRTLSGKYGQL